MSPQNIRELRIVGFLCNWCSYGGADTAGVGRFVQPTDLRIIRVPCSGRIDPLFIVRAFMNGADGVLVSGCHPRDCHYAEGNFYARRRLEMLKRFLPITGIDNRRFEYTWVSASEGQRWQHVVTEFTRGIHTLGPAPSFNPVSETEWNKLAVQASEGQGCPCHG
ncbi:MAG: hydrogenase iron-sulfur subunit [Desulfomicrobium sp.]|jgi:coenzyme F420-reducing hydrogenase delta subunit|nr:hydrogenase iron-sulfur subunit [Desulfomicrobium sp.]NLV96338.1 hydrogenase iron-sulfur subunit [Desulfovibrionales bacterium]